MVNKDTFLNPRIRARGVALRVFGEEMAAEPVPVRRHGVLVIGSEDFEAWFERSTGEETGRMNIGLNLTELLICGNKLVRPSVMGD